MTIKIHRPDGSQRFAIQCDRCGVRTDHYSGYYTALSLALDEGWEHYVTPDKTSDACEVCK